MKKYFVLLFVVFFSSCKTEPEITIHKVQGSPEYPNAKLSLEEPIITQDGYEFSFNVDQYQLGLHAFKNATKDIVDEIKILMN